MANPAFEELPLELKGPPLKPETVAYFRQIQENLDGLQTRREAAQRAIDSGGAAADDGENLTDLDEGNTEYRSVRVSNVTCAQ